jgi:PIN domain nuclease of toxin-antitoxin system
MTYLLDTHALLAFLADREGVGRNARRILDRIVKGAGDARVSVISLWEVSLLLEKGRIKLRAGWSAWSTAVRRIPGLTIEPLTAEDIEHASTFPTLVDPADRIIVGTALRLGATLITGDERITESRVVPVLW